MGVRYLLEEGGVELRVARAPILIGDIKKISHNPNDYLVPLGLSVSREQLKEQERIALGDITIPFAPSTFFLIGQGSKKQQILTLFGALYREAEHAARQNNCSYIILSAHEKQAALEEDVHRTLQQYFSVSEKPSEYDVRELAEKLKDAAKRYTISTVAQIYG